MDVTLNVFVLCGALAVAFAVGFVIMGVLANGGRASLEEEHRLRRCPNCGHFMLKDRA